MNCYHVKLGSFRLYDGSFHFIIIQLHTVVVPLWRAEIAPRAPSSTYLYFFFHSLVLPRFIIYCCCSFHDDHHDARYEDNALRDPDRVPEDPDRDPEGSQGPASRFYQRSYLTAPQLLIRSLRRVSMFQRVLVAVLPPSCLSEACGGSNKRAGVTAPQRPSSLPVEDRRYPEMLLQLLHRS